MASWLSEIARAEGGRLRFDRFMELALLHPEHGYYANRIRHIGKSGDFSTSTTLDSSLAKAIFRWVTAEAGHLGMDRLTIIELGIGTGALAKGILAQTRPWQRLRYFGVDLDRDRPFLDKTVLGHRRFRSFSSVEKALGEAQGTALILSNEFVDAFPCRRLVRLDSGWADIHLRFENDQWHQELLPAEIAYPCSALSTNFAVGQMVEVHESLRNWLSRLSTALTCGSMLTIDYGGRPEEIYSRRPGGTIRGYFRHQRVEGVEIFHRVGQQDLTADVNFVDLQTWGDSFGLKTVEYTTQRDFIARRYPDALRRPPAATAFTLAENGAGSAFKVLHQRKA